MTSGPKPGDETTRLHFKYDAWNRLVAAKADDGYGNPGTTIATYEFDGLNRRITKVLADGTTTQTFFNENWQALEDRTTSGVTTAVNQFLWDLSYIDAPVLRWTDAAGDGTFEQTIYFTWDANHNVTSVLNTDGTIAEHYAYASYGKASYYTSTWTLAAQQQSAVGNTLLFAGYWLDTETGLMDVRYRAYHTTLSTFVVTDPIEADPNTYRYCENMPTVATDPVGLDIILYRLLTWADFGKAGPAANVRWAAFVSPYMHLDASKLKVVEDLAAGAARPQFPYPGKVENDYKKALAAAKQAAQSHLANVRYHSADQVGQNEHVLTLPGDPKARSKTYEVVVFRFDEQSVMAAVGAFVNTRNMKVRKDVLDRIKAREKVLTDEQTKLANEVQKLTKGLQGRGAKTIPKTAQKLQDKIAQATQRVQQLQTDLDELKQNLLRHEQGHFDITELYARMLRADLRSARVVVIHCGRPDDEITAAAEKMLKTLAASRFTVINRRQDSRNSDRLAGQYDFDTRHNLARDQQTQAQIQAWRNRLTAALTLGEVPDANRIESLFPAILGVP